LLSLTWFLWWAKIGFEPEGLKKDFGILSRLCGREILELINEIQIPKFPNFPIPKL